MRRLHARGRASRGLVVDADGAMLGPDCVLVRRTPAGYRCLAPDEAAAIQAAVLGPGREPGWLFEQTRRIAGALARGETALAQIYGLRIPVGELDDATLARLAAASRLIKANFNPDQPRVPEGEPGAGQWVYEPGYAKPRTHGYGADDGGGNTGSSDPASSSGSSDRKPSPDTGGGDPPPIPAKQPETPQQRNKIARRAAEWLKRAIALNVEQVRSFLQLVETTWWLADNLPSILSYLDQPKTLEELHSAVARPRAGYQRHHVVEGHYDSTDPSANSKRFKDRLETRENLVRIPYWRHVEISSWYSRASIDYGGMSPRAYLRGKTWEVQYEFGLKALRDAGVLR